MKNLTASQSANKLSTLIAPFINKELFLEDPQKEIKRAFLAYQEDKYSKMQEDLIKELTSPAHTQEEELTSEQKEELLYMQEQERRYQEEQDIDPRELY